MLDAFKLQSDIESVLDGQSVTLKYLQSCASTNRECMQLNQHHAVVISEHQTHGRGRRGKDWHSPPQQNIYCSLGVLKSIQAEYLGLISLLVGLSIAQVLQESGLTDVQLKWPNDILYEGKKLGGILIETQPLQDQDFYLVIGFGLNINLGEQALNSIEQPATSLNNILPQPVKRQQLLPLLIARILNAVNQFELTQLAGLLDQFTRFDCFQGKMVSVKTHAQTLQGLYQGLEPDGQVRIKIGNSIQTFAAAEISLRRADHVID